MNACEEKKQTLDFNKKVGGYANLTAGVVSLAYAGLVFNNSSGTKIGFLVLLAIIYFISTYVLLFTDVFTIECSGLGVINNDPRTEVAILAVIGIVSAIFIPVFGGISHAENAENARLTTPADPVVK